MDTGQPKDLTRQAEHDEYIYELILYVAGNKTKSQLAFDNLKKICSKYLAGKYCIEIIDLTKNPNLARAGSDHSHSYSCEKELPWEEDHRRSLQSRKDSEVLGYMY